MDVDPGLPGNTTGGLCPWMVTFLLCSWWKKENGSLRALDHTMVMLKRQTLDPALTAGSWDVTRLSWVLPQWVSVRSESLPASRCTKGTGLP